MFVGVSILFAAISFLLWRRLQRAQRLLLLKDQELETLRKQGSEFVANVSHELKTPLTSIKGFTETLKDVITRDPLRAADFLTRIEENAERLSHLINDILELSRIEQPNFYLEKKEFRIDDLLKEIQDRFTFRISQKKQLFVIENKVETLMADRWLVDQALGNLIENAHRYCGEEAVITVSVKNLNEQGKPFVQFLVSDNGPGISERDLPQIFDRFYRADKSRDRSLGGTGLGLAIAKHIMLSHGGLIRAESEPGKGSRFFLLFPR